MKNFKEVLKTSLEMEKKGYIFYLKVIKRAKSKLTKRAFKTLAKDELNHQEAIKRYIFEISQNMPLSDIKKIIKREPESSVKKFFNRPIKPFLEKIKASEDELEAYKTGMEIETAGYNFYKKSMDEAEDRNARSLLDFLLKEESGHFTMLQETYKYLKDPESFFKAEEKPIYEGG